MPALSFDRSIAQILPAVFADADTMILDYIIGALTSTYTTAKPPKNVNAIAASIGDMLLDYELIPSPQQIIPTCTTIAQKLNDAGFKIDLGASKQTKPPVESKEPTSSSPNVSANEPVNSKKPANTHKGGVDDGIVFNEDGMRMKEVWVNATERHRPRIKPNTKCKAKYWEDNQFYSAVVTECLPIIDTTDATIDTSTSGKFLVLFPDYGNTEVVELSHIKLFDKISFGSIFASEDNSNSDVDDNVDRGDGDVNLDAIYTTKLLRAPVRIMADDDTESKKRKEEKSAKDNAKALFLSKKQLKKEAKERGRQAVMARLREEKRKRAEQIRADAIFKYLNSSADGKGNEIDIPHIQLSTIDGSRELLSDAHLKFLPGRRYGLVGRNGIGKTTLLRALNYYEIQNFPTHLRVVHVEQEAAPSEESVINTVLKADLERELLLAEEAKLLAMLDADIVAAARKSQLQHKMAYLEQQRQSRAERAAAYASESQSDEFDEEGKSLDEMMKELELEEEQLNDSEPTSDNDAEDDTRSDIASTITTVSDTDSLNSTAVSSSASVTSSHAPKDARDSNTLDKLAPEQRLQKVYQRMAETDTDGAEARARIILQGLQFSAARQDTKVKELSGGWRMRVALAQALFVQPDLLLLDEPTNHLDFPAVLWLEEYLQSYDNTLVVVSHDRTFLNNVVTDIIHYYHGTLTYYKGDYVSFERQRLERQKTMKREFEAQQLKREHIQQFIDRFRYNANRAALVQSRVKMLQKMDELQDIVQDTDIKFTFPQVDKLDGLILQTTDVSFGYNINQMLLKKVTVGVDMDSRVGVLGANGVGKTTLINVMIGKLEPSEGLVHRDGGARLAVFAQHHIDNLRLDLCAVDLFMQMFQLGSQHMQSVRRHLGGFGISGPLATQAIGSLSGGQKSRVAFAVVTWKKPHLVVMDEPTNHLDLETIDALINALAAWQGGVLAVSHDQHFLSHVCSEFWSVSNGSVKRFDSLTAAKKFTYRSA